MHHRFGKLCAALVLVAVATVPGRAARFAHTATLLQTGNVFVAGGVDATGNVTNSVALINEQSGVASDPVPLLAMSVARASHTATLLADGRVFIFGGVNNAGVPQASGEIYDPVPAPNGAFSGSIGFPGTARYNHTATLLQSGKVLLCGGQSSTSIAQAFINDCWIFDPTGNTYAGPVPMLAPNGRAMHTATLTNDGRVFLTGGFSNPAGGPMTALSTSELYQPAPTGGFTGAKALIRGRANHQATMMGDGRILITGGVDGQDKLASYMRVETSEIYDPLSDSIQSAAPMEVRRAFHTTTLKSDGRIFAFGGIGNLTTTYLFAGGSSAVSPHGPETVIGQLQSGTLNGCFTGACGHYTATAKLSTMTINDQSSTATFLLKTYLSVPVQGIITNGEILMSSPAAKIPGGKAEFVYGQPDDGVRPYANGGNASNDGLKIDLAGTYVGCDPNGKCGFINQPYTLQDVEGTYQFDATGLTISGDPGQTKDRACVGYAGAIGNNTGPANIQDVSCNYRGANNTGTAQTLSYACGHFKLPLDKAYLGGTITSMSIQILSGQGSYQNPNNADPGNGGGGYTFTATLSNAIATTAGAAGVGQSDFNPATPSVVPDGAGGAQALFEACFHGLSGTITASTSTTNTHTSPADAEAGVNNNAPTATLQAATGVQQLVIDKVDLTGQDFKIDVGTIIVRNMVFDDFECYFPGSNLWTYGDATHPCVLRSPGFERWQASSTLLPSGDVRIYGGQTCLPSGPANNPQCAPMSAAELGLNIGGAIPFFSLQEFSDQKWTAGAKMSAARGNFTTTTLPDGRFLISGGTDGQTTLSSTDIFDPVSKSFTPVGRLNLGRDLHTATLLTNGRVLVAGGFVSGGASTGTTSTSEIFYPNSNTWAFTSSMNEARDNHTATVMPDGNVIVIGGYKNGQYLDSVEIYYSTAGAWKFTTPMGAANARALHSATLLKDGRLFIAGGVNASGPLNSALIFDPVGANWSAAMAMPVKLHSHGAALLANGDVLIAGGDDGFGEKDSSLRYTPAINNWTSTTGKLGTARMNHTMTLLPNGLVLAAGGATANGNTLITNESFHTQSDAWLPVSSFTVARAYHTTTVARDGTMYALGGYDGVKFRDDSESIFFTSVPDEDTFPTARASVRQSSITATDKPVMLRGQEFSVYGRFFKGQTSASGGEGGFGNSDAYHPRLTLQALDGSSGGSTQGSSGFILDMSTYIALGTAWSLADGTATIAAMPPNQAALPYGWYHMREISNSVYSPSLLIQAGPALPSTPVTNIVPVPNPPASASVVNWSWTAPSAGSWDGYNVYSATSGFLLQQVTGTPAPPTNFTQNGLLPNTTVQIAVAPYSLSGDGPLAVSATFFTLAAIPGAPYVSSVTFNSLLLQWPTSGNTPGTIYEVLMSTVDALVTGPAISTPIPALLGLTTNHVVISPLLPKSQYWLSVRAYNGAGAPTDFAAPVVTTVTRQGVGGLSGAAISATSIGWGWTGAPLNTAVGEHYNIYDATTGVIIASTANPAFIDVGLATNSARVLQVSAVTKNGATLSEGPITGGVTVYTLAAVPVADPLVPISNVSTGGFTVAWQPNGNPPGTTYQCVINNGSAFSSTATTTGLSCGVSGTTPAAQLFSIKVRAINNDTPPIATDATNPNNILNMGSTSTLANQPTSLTLLGTTPSSISVAWNSNNNSSSATYEVQYSTDGFLTDIKKALPFSAHSNQTSLTIGSLLTSTTYSIRVYAENLSGIVTAPSNVITTGTFNGGAPAGSLGGFVPKGVQTTLTGSLGNGRQVTLFMPTGAFPVDTFVAISSFDTTAPGGNPCNGAAVGISILTFPPVQPLHPIYLTLSYNPGEVASITDLNQGALERFDPTANRCVPLQTTFDTANQKFTAQLNHFSQFQLAQVTPGSSPDFTTIFPNPFYPTRGNGYVTFMNMPKAAHVRIFTLRGEELWDGNANASGLLTWTGINHAGRPAASGVYLAVVDDGSKTHVYKVAVVR